MEPELATSCVGQIGLDARRPLDSITGHGDTFQIWCSPFFFGSVRRSAFQALASAVKPTREVSGSNALHRWSCPFDLYCDDEVTSGPG